MIPVIDNTNSISMLQGNLNSVLHIEALELSKKAILEHLAGKVRRIKFLYQKEDLTPEQVKRINSEDEHIRAVIRFIEDAEITIRAIQEESQMLRLKCEALAKDKAILFKSAAAWKQEYQNANQQQINLIETIQRIKAKNEAA